MNRPQVGTVDSPERTRSFSFNSLGSLLNRCDKMDEQGLWQESHTLSRETACVLQAKFSRLSLADIYGLNVVFDEVDTDNTAGVGSERALHFSELEAMLKNDGSEGLLGVAREIFQEMDDDENGMLTFDEFLMLVNNNVPRSPVGKDSPRGTLGLGTHTIVELRDNAKNKLVDSLNNVREEIQAAYGRDTASAPLRVQEQNAVETEKILARCCFFHPPARYDDRSARGFSTDTSLSSLSKQKRHISHDFRLWWDIAQIPILGFVGVMVPYISCFNVDNDNILVDMMIDVYFWIDILLNFRTAYYDEDTGELVHDNRKVAKFYLKGWFIIDFLASLPLTYVELAMRNDKSVNYSQNLRMLKILRLLRITKILRVARYFRLIERLRSEYPEVFESMRSARLASWCGAILYLAHLCACVWYWAGTGSTHLEDGTVLQGWAMANGWTNNSSVNYWHRYLDAYYFAVTTLTTVGYGDRTPTTDSEKVFAIVCELVGGMLFASAAGTVSAMMVEQSAADARIERELTALHEFMHDKRVTKKLRHEITSIYEHRLQLTKYDEREVISKLRPGYQRDLKYGMYKDKLEKCPMFKGLGDVIIREICFRMVPYPAMKGDTLFTEGDECNHIFMILSGEVEMTSTSPNFSSLHKKVWVDGAVFGELHMLNLGAGPKGVQAWYTATAQGDCELSCLSRTALHEAERTLGEDYQQLQDQMLRLASKRAQRFKVNLPSQHRSLGAALNSKMGRRRPAQPTSAPSNLGKEPPSTDAENICGIARLSMTAEMPAVGGGPALVDGTPRPPPPPKRSSPRAEHATEMQPLYPPNAATTNALDLVDTW